eukprot:CAMPEP_0170730564 /NCGR_PEP_ID=MMETSP0437-20130122/598_1 /TAXON_ID=0 /ORGANISM="Sexangularia sp." /LENGTH=243 /DNA_ID=CAMNT_0011068767 /DNA_START=1 /DNA_END=732 /DNA_ORIENTATION=+
MNSLVVLCFYVVGVVVFVLEHLVGIRAAYGRYSSRSWGPLIPAPIAWFVQEAPSFFIPAIALVYSRRSFHPVLYLYLVHYALRTFVYPLLIRGGKPTPASAALAAFAFCTINGALQTVAASFAVDQPVTSVRFILGATVWAVGLLSNWHCDSLLRSLRADGSTGYKIPRGGLFTYVSCGNLASESLEWLGYALAAGHAGGPWAFAFFTVANLAPRAHHHHAHYLALFPTYASLNRKAFIPFLW